MTSEQAKNRGETAPEPLLRLTRAIEAHMARASPPSPAMRNAITHLVEALRRAIPQPAAASARDYTVLVQRAVETARHSPAADIALHLLSVQRSLPWVYHYTPRSADEDLGDRIAFAELAGPDGAMSAPHCRVGFTVVAERTIYPMHSHPAVELYLVLGGTAKWQTPTSDRCVPPGEFLLHRSNEPHAMRTFDEPLLALWSWSGDIDAPAVYV